ncbi:MAG: DUF1697 domain-containing protein [Candidatus Gracilibacteria bacterium]
MTKNQSIKYLAFLRGINVGGHHKVKMDDLKKIFVDLGFLNVKTVIASGNVYFESTESDAVLLRNHIEEALLQTFSFAIPTIIRTQKEIQDLVISDPYKGKEVTKNTRLYITFLGARHNSMLKAPYMAPAKDYEILQITDKEVVSILELNPEHKTLDSMNVLGQFGNNVTTRNWNTVMKMAAL